MYVQGQRSEVKVTETKFKVSKIDFKLGAGNEIKAQGLRGVGLPQDAMHSQLPHWLDFFFLFFFYRNTALSSRGEAAIKCILEVRS